MSTRAKVRTAVPLLVAAFLVAIVGILPVTANSNPQTLPYSQSWSSTGLITLDDNWTSVPGVVGYLGSNLTASEGIDPQGVTVDNNGTDVDVVANQSAPPLSQGGVAEFESGDPVIALKGTSTADAPNIVITLNTVGESNIFITYNLRDIDPSTANAMQAVAVQYRVGTSGTFTNLPAGFVDDATTGPSLATLVTPVEVALPGAAEDKSAVQVRIITTNASGTDEWVGIDDISIASSEDAAPTVDSTTPADGAVDVLVNANLGVTFSEPVNVSGTLTTLVCRISGSHTVTVSGGPTTYTLNPDDDFAHSETCTLTVRARAVRDVDTVDPPDRMGLDRVVRFTTIPPDDAPAVTGLTPNDGATDVDPTANLEVTFSEPVNVAAGWYSIDCATSGAHNAAISGGPSTFTLDPDTDLAYAETCVLTVSAANVSDQDNNDPPDHPADGASASFTTMAPPDVAPAVASTDPVDGATDVALDAAVTVTFSEAVDAGAGWYELACATSGDHSAAVTGGPTVFSIDADADFAHSESCTLTVHAAMVTDQDTDDPPDAMDADAMVTFTTAAPDNAPTVVDWSPADGATDVAVDTDLTVTFSEPVDPTGAWYSIECATSGTHDASVSGGPTTWSLDPTGAFAPDETCTLTVVASNVADQDGNDPPDTMAGDESVDFTTTAAAPTNQPPTVGAGGPYAVPEGGSVELTATGTDPDGDPIDYAWDLDGNGTFETAGRTVTFSAAGIVAPASRTVSVRGTDPSGAGDTDTATVSITWQNGGFGPPIGGGGSGPVTAKAGATVPVKFSLGGDQGLDIMRSGYPASAAFTCGAALPHDASEPVEFAGGGGLKYDPVADMYSFQWKTDKAWKNTCRVLVVGLQDGTNLAVGFQFN